MENNRLNRVRLTPRQLDLIRLVAKETLHVPYGLYLFGSRLEPEAKGGDIDLMLEFLEPCQEAFKLSSQFKAKVMMALGGLKVDVILKAEGFKHLSIHDVALAEGVQL